MGGADNRTGCLPPQAYKLVTLLHSSPNVIWLIVLMYVGVVLSLRTVEDLLFEQSGGSVLPPEQYPSICHHRPDQTYRRSPDARRQRVSGRPR